MYHRKLTRGITVVTNACSQPRLTRRQKALEEGWAGDEETGMLFLSLSDQTGGTTGWLTDRLEEGLAQAWCLAAGSDIEWERWLAEDWCVTLSGTLRRCLTANLATSQQVESIYKSHAMRRRLRKAWCYWCKACRKVGRVCHTHTQQ